MDQMNFKPTPPPELTEKQKQSPLMKYYNMDIEPVPADLAEQVMKMTDGKGVDKVVIAGGTVETFEPAVKCLKAGGRIGSVNYLGSGTYVTIPRAEWGAGMANKNICGGLMPGGRRRLEKLGSLVSSGKLDVKKLITHPFKGFEHVEDALMLMKDKPADLIKPVVVL